MNFKQWLIAESQQVLDWALKRFGDQKKAQAFSNWFKDSKIVNEDGTPKVVMHFTKGKFSKFDISHFGKTDYGYFGIGFYFTEDALGNYGNIKMELYLSIQNPYVVQDYDDPLFPDNYYGRRIPEIKRENPELNHKQATNLCVQEWTDMIKKKGHDGVYVPENKEIVAFYPNQIKSAERNTGSFDPNNPDIHDEAEPGGRGTLVLAPQDDPSKPLRIQLPTAVVGKALFRSPDARFMADRQFVVSKRGDGWQIAHHPEARNSTNLNGKPLGPNPTPLGPDDTIALGRTNQMPIKVSFS